MTFTYFADIIFGRTTRSSFLSLICIDRWVTYFIQFFITFLIQFDVLKVVLHNVVARQVARTIAQCNIPCNGTAVIGDCCCGFTSLVNFVINRSYCNVHYYLKYIIKAKLIKKNDENHYETNCCNRCRK